MGPLPPSICVLCSDVRLGYPRARPDLHLTHVAAAAASPPRCSVFCFSFVR